MDLRTYLNQKRGTAADLARKLEVSPVLLSQWANQDRNVPAERCPMIEHLTAGAVTCEELRPDVQWVYLRRACNAEFDPIEPDAKAAA